MRRRHVLTGLGGVGCVLARPASAQDHDGISIVERFAATLSAHDLASFAGLFAADYINHQVSAAMPAPLPGVSVKQATVDLFASRLRAMPDFLVTVETALAAPVGIPATGRRLRFTSCDIFTVMDEQLTEHWGMGDIAGVMAQLKG